MKKKINPTFLRKETSVKESILPLLWLNRILGLSIFEIPLGNPWPKLSILYALLRSIGYAYAYLQWYNKTNIIGTDDDLVVVVIYNVIVNSSIFIAAVSTILGILQYKKIEKILKNISLLDETLKIFGVDPDHATLRREIITTVVIWCFGVLIIFISDFVIYAYAVDNFYAAILRIIAYEIPLVMNPVVEINFIVYLKQLHLNMTTLSEDVSNTCNKQMSLQMAANFIIITGNCYCFYIVTSKPNISWSEKIRHDSSLIVWTVVSAIRMIYVVHICVKVMREAQRTSQVAHEIQVSNFKNTITNEIHELSLQIVQHPIHFSASGLVAFDFGYIQGFVGSVTTYLMILIQNHPSVMEAANPVVGNSTMNTTIGI